MAHQKSYAQIMAHSMLVLPLQIAALNGISPMKIPAHTTHSPMDLLSHVLNSQAYTAMCQVQWYKSKDCTTAPRPPQWMPNFTHPLRCFTTARYIPLDHLGSAILTQQLCRFKSTLRIEPRMPCPMLISTPKQLASFHAGQPIATLDTPRKIWIPATVVCPSQKQLPSMHCKWNHLPPYQMPPLGMQCQMQQC